MFVDATGLAFVARRTVVVLIVPTAEATVIDDVFRLTNLSPSTTGLPMTVWIGPRVHKGDVATILVITTHGDVTRLSSAVVAIEPEPRLLKGYLSGDGLAKVVAWIEVNQTALLALWRGEIEGGDLAERLKRVA
jgi:hypothetical protein